MAGLYININTRPVLINKTFNSNDSTISMTKILSESQV